MPKVADFVTFSGDGIELHEGSNMDHILVADIPDAPASGEGALLTWGVRCKGPSSTVEYTVKVNGENLQNYNIEDNRVRVVQEVISFDRIHKGDNTVEFQMTKDSSKGSSMLFSDVTLWYRKSV